MGLDLQGDEEEVGFNFICMNSSVCIFLWDLFVVRVYQWVIFFFLVNLWLKIILGRFFYVKGFFFYFLMLRLRVFFC